MSDGVENKNMSLTAPECVDAGKSEEAVGYVDGSYNAATGEYACGVLVFAHGTVYSFSEKYADPELALMRNVAGELAGARLLMDFCLQNEIRSVALYYDYAGIEHWCTGAWKTNKEGTKAYKAYYDGIKDRLAVRFHKVTGHSGDRYNDLADLLAKRPLGLLSTREEEKLSAALSALTAGEGDARVAGGAAANGGFAEAGERGNEKKAGPTALSDEFDCGNSDAGVADVDILPTTTDDAAALLSIYSYYATQTAVSFEYDPPTEEEFRERIALTLQSGFPYLKAVRDGRIVGFAYAGRFHPRRAYRHCAELTVYLDKESRGAGIGRALYEELEQQLRKRGFLNLYALVADTVDESEDPYLTKDSIFFHEAQGYRIIGEFHKCGYKFGRWYNMVTMEKLIGEHV